MNLNKKDNSGWILCPSKSFPGKFYYFNVLNGGAAWSLNDADQKAMRKDLQKADKSHSFPEPLGPPAQSPTTNIGLNIQKPVPNIVRSFTNKPQTTPTFGQATFPTFLSNVDPYTLNILWAPMVPMRPQLWQGQSTPTCDSSREIFVQTCDIPLSKRFINYEEPKTILEPSSSIKVFGQSRKNCDPVIKSSNNLQGASPKFGQIIHSQENYSINKLGRPRTHSESNNVGTFFDNDENLGNSGQIFDVAGKNSNVESIKKVTRLRTLSESDSVIFEKPDQLNPTFNQSLINQSSQNGESSEANIQSKSSFVLRKSLLNLNQIKNTGQLENNDKEKVNQHKKNINDSSLGNLEKNDWGENKKADLLGNLDENDLRHALVKKRRKCVDLGITNHVEENQYKVPATNKQKEPVKKRVMFNIDSTEESSEENQECDDNQPQVTIHTLRGLVDSTNGQWYVAVDSRVLLDDYDFIEKFVKLDKQCRLFVPHVVKLEIEEFCFGDCRGQQRVIVARQLTRRLAMPPPHIVVQPAQNEDKVFTTMSTILRILNSCIDILQQRDHAVLITDDSVLYEKAKFLKIHCFKLKEIKDGATHFSLEKESNPFSNINRIPVYNSKITFNNDAKNCDLLTDVKNTTDANTSPINFEETIVKRKEKSRDYLNFNYDSDSDASVISKTMVNLKIRDKNSNFLHKNSNDNKLDDRKSNSFTFQIKNKKNIMPEKEQKSSQLQNSKKESAFSEPKENFPLQIQNKIVAGQKEFQTKSETVTSKVEQFKKSIGDKLKQRFQVKSKFMDENIRSNIDEWICTFRQIMEYSLSEYLQATPQEIPPTLPPPWTLHEAVTCVRRVHAGRGEWKVTAIADELSMLLLNNCCKRGELKRDIKPEEFLRVFGCGAMLLELLADPSLHDGRRQLREMFNRMLKGTEHVDLITTPVRRDDGDEPIRHNFPKKSTDIIQYLKNHFPAWRGYVESTRDEVITQIDKKIVRTFGRNLNLLTIDKSKSIVLRESPDKTNDDKAISRQSSEINLSENTLIHSQSTVKLNDSNEPKIIRLFDTSIPFNNKVTQANNTTHNNNISLTPKHGNTFDDKETDGPKVIRNIKLIDEFEKKLKSKTNDEECNSNAESFSLSDVSLCSSVDRNNKAFGHNNDVNSINDKNPFNDCKEQNNDDKPNGSSTNDSGFENESDTYTVVQTFLSELSGSLKLIYGFIDDSMAEFREKELENDKRKSIFDKASVTQLHLSGIIYKLKCIVERESDEVTPLKEFISKADMLVVGDIRLMKYRQVVMKCLEHAQLLESALKILLGISEGHYDVMNCTDRQNFLNIFE